MKHPIESSILRILKPNGETIGTGFLVSQKLAVTCTHVVLNAGMDGENRIKVLFSNEMKPITAKVLEQTFNDIDLDIAILQLDTIPAGVIPIRLGRASESRLNNPLYSFGYARAAGEQGIGGSGIFIRMEGKFIQFRMHEADHGHSGAPLYDENRGVVIGLIKKGKDELGRNDDTTFAIAAETFLQVCPEIPIETTFQAMTQEILSLPGWDKVDLVKIQKIYHYCLIKTTLPNPLSVITLKLSEMVQHLGESIPLPQNQAHPLAYFAATVDNHLRISHPELSRKIHDWLVKYSDKLIAAPMDLSALIQIDPDEINPPCLQISLERSTLNQPNEDPKNQMYKLKVRDARANQSILPDTLLEFRKLASFIRVNAIGKIFDRLTSDEASEFEDQLWIEFVLRTEDLSRKVDYWVADETGKTLGQKYKLVVRSLYRWENRMELHKTWPGKWSTCHACVVNQPVDLKYDIVKETNVAAFQKAVEHIHVVGLPFELRDDETNGNLLTVLLNSGAPVAIWVRQGVDLEQAEKWLQAYFVDHLDLRHLAEYVRLERQSGSELGGALVLLWDNYDRKLGEEDSFIAPPLQGEDVPW